MPPAMARRVPERSVLEILESLLATDMSRSEHQAQLSGTGMDKL